MSLSVVSSRWPRELRALVLLGRVSNLPTVWSNCLAGWILSGGGSWMRFFLLCLGTSCLYLGGMFLNDAFDIEFDSQFRTERPIPSGSIGAGQVWGWGLGWILSGLILLSLLGKTSLVLALFLVAAILLYDAVHKIFTLSPLVMALCRWLVYLLAGAASGRNMSGLVIWSGLALALYVVGLSYLARGERARGPAPYWPCWLLAAPLFLAWIVNGGEYTMRAIALSVILVIWIVRCLRESLWTPMPSVGRTVSGLLAGICLVDLLAIVGGTPASGLCFIGFFLLSLAGQRFVPAT